MNSANFNVKFGEVINTGGTNDFNQLINLPKYDSVTMSGNTNIPKVPTATSELTNNSGFITGAELGAETTAREQADNTLQGEIDGLNNSKADKSTTYTKTEVDTALDAKADKSTTYTKTEVDTALDLKADKSTTYTKTETDGLIGEIAGKIKVLTTDDYNWPTDNPTGVAPWLLDEGWYTGEDGVRLYQSPTGSTYITLFKGKTFYVGVGTGPGGDQYYRTKYIYRIGEHALADDGGVYRSVYAWITWFANDNSGVQTMYFPSLADLSERVVQKAGAPTTSSEGVLGQLWEDSSNGELYQLKSIDTSVTPNTYTWEQVGGGPTVVQTTGISTTDVMSQNAVTQAIFASGYDPATSQTDIRVQIGGSTTAGGNAISIGQGSQSSGYGSVAIGAGCNAKGGNSVCIGRDSSSSQNAVQGDVVIGDNASATGDSSVSIGNNTKGFREVVSLGHFANASAVASIACGQSSAASGSGSIALGAYAESSKQGEMNIGSADTFYGYNNSNYRLLSGVYDGQSAHDAATVGQITPTTDSSAPTAATAGRLGEIRIDTTTNTAYMCVLSDSSTPSYEWKQITA